MSKYCYAVCAIGKTNGEDHQHSRVITTDGPLDDVGYLEAIDRIKRDLGWDNCAVLSFTLFYWPDLARGDELLAELENLFAVMACHDKTPEETLALEAAKKAIAKARGDL